MIILTIRTDKPESEIGLFNDNQQIDYMVWQAHRKLAETINQKIDDLLTSNKFTLNDLGGIVILKGPGSFTGLRIGISVANALAFSYKIPITGIYGENEWIEKGIKILKNGKAEKIVIPEYGAPVNITTPKK